jgi:16S rRNA (cytosine967-C5)-methyltransferase
MPFLTKVNMQIKLPDPKKRQTLGKSDRKFVAETIYEIVRWKDYTQKYEVKEPLTEIILRMFSVWAVLRGYPIDLEGNT